MKTFASALRLWFCVERSAGAPAERVAVNETGKVGERLSRETAFAELGEIMRPLCVFLAHQSVEIFPSE